MKNALRLAAIGAVITTMSVTSRVGSMASPVLDCTYDAYSYTTYTYFWWEDDAHSATNGGARRPPGTEGLEEYTEGNWVSLGPWHDDEVAHTTWDWGEASDVHAPGCAPDNK
jgi:hypothetical protein